MSDVPVQLIVAAFQAEDGADRALQALKEAKKADWIRIDNAAVIRRDVDGKLHIKETADMGGGKGAAVGGAIGAVLGIIFPPTILASAAIGAALGGVIAKVSDGGFPDKRLREIGEALKPGTSAIVAVIEHVWVAAAEQALAEQGAQVMVESLKADISEQLAAGRDVAFSAVATSEGMTVARQAVGEDHVEMSELTATADTVTAVSAVADKEGGQVAALVSDAEGTTVMAADLVPAPPEKPAAEAAPAPEAETPAAPTGEAGSESQPAA